MADDKETSSKIISEEALDTLLAQWAEAELEPPVGFHERTMERLQQEQLAAPETKKNRNVISLFVKKKKWMSAAAAAVLVLCCIPVVQAQFGNDVTHSVNDELTVQQKQIESVADGTETAAVEPEAQDSNGQQKAYKEPANQTAQQASTNTETAPQPSQQQAEQESVGIVQAISSFSDSSQNVDAAGEEQTPSALSADPDDGLAAVDNGLEKGLQAGRSVTESLEQLQQQAQFYQEALDDVMDTMEALQKDLDDYDEKLKNDPENPELQAKVKELQQQMDTLKREVEELQSLVDEAKAKLSKS